MTDSQTNSTTQNSNIENVPWYLKKADRPKNTVSLRLFTADIDYMTDIGLTDNRSAFVRYFFDCYRAGVIPTFSGFKEYLSNGEKPLVRENGPDTNTGV